MVLQLLAALVGAVFFFHGHRPYAPSHAAHDGVLGVHAVAEEERQIGSKVVDVHAACQIGFDKCEAVGQREGQLRNRVGPRFSDVVTADGHAVEIAHLVLDKVLGNVAHDFE